MHDFHLADLIYKAIIEEAKNNNLSKVTKATIELGSIIEHGEEVLPENLDFNIKMLAEGGIADGIELMINRGSGDNWVLKEIDGE
jgi:Zn finger protein HypA/HybF involved in hydrogenase expression